MRPPANAAPIPERVGRYEILARIASGGMATVYLARARGLGGFERDVALKVTHAHLRESPEFAAILLDEAKLAVRIRHTNVVPVLDVGDDPQGVFLVMEYVEGDTLSGLLRKGAAMGSPMPRGVAMRILLDALAGLHATHELKDENGQPLEVVHRDFSPHNVLVGTDGVAKLTDFGIAKAAARVSHTASGVIKGKASYMAPEQARGHKVDRRCDVWAAGVVAWELVARRKLHADLDGIATLLRVVSETPPRLATVIDVPPELDDAVARALTLDVSARTPTAAAFARELAGAFSTRARIAEPSDVTAYVEAVVGAALEQRRALRRARRADDTEPAPPPPIDLVEAVAEENAPNDATVPAAPFAREEPTRTETTAASDARITSPPAARTRGRWIVALGVAATAIAVSATAFVALRGERDAGSTAGIAASSATAAAASTAPPAPAPPTSASAPPEIAASALPAASPKTTSRPTARPVKHAGQPPPAPTTTPGPAPLAPSPYP